MKISVIADAEGTILGVGHPPLVDATLAKNRLPRHRKSKAVVVQAYALPGQTLHEIELPDEALHQQRVIEIIEQHRINLVAGKPQLMRKPSA